MLILHSLPVTLLSVALLSGFLIAMYPLVSAQARRYAAAFAYCRQLFVLPLLAASLLLSGPVAATTPDSVSGPAPRRGVTTLSIGGMVGTSNQYFDFRSFANRSTRNGQYQQRYQLTSVGVAHSWPILKRSLLTLELLAATGRTQFAREGETGSREKLYSLSPYLEISKPQYFRFGMGASLGNLAYDYVYDFTRMGRSRPQILLEAGKFSVLYLHSSYGRDLLGLGNGTGVFGLGSGFGSPRQRLLLGAALVNSEINAGILTRTTSSFIPVAQAQIWLGDKWLLEPHLASNFRNVSQGRLQIRYSLPDRAR